MKKYKAIIFDCDGVLVDSETLTMQCFIDTLKEYQVNISLLKALEMFKGKAFNQVIPILENNYNIVLEENFEQNFRAKTFEVFEKEIQPIEGVVELISSLEVPFAVASNGPRHKMDLTLKTTGLIDFFGENIFSAYDIGFWKPDPHVFLTAAEFLGYAPEECLVIEDSMSGVMAAKNGGFDVMVYAKGQESSVFEEKEIPIFYEMKELNNYV